MSQQRALAVSVTVLIAFLTLIQAADPVTLGISAQFVAWSGILAGALGVLLGFLPRVQGGK